MGMDRISKQDHAEPAIRRDEQRGPREAGVPKGVLCPVAPILRVKPPTEAANVRTAAGPPRRHGRKGLPVENSAVGSEQMSDESGEILERGEQARVSRHPAEGVGVPVMHLAPHEFVAKALIAVQFGCSSLLFRAWPKAGPGHAEHKCHLLGKKLVEPCAATGLEDPAEKHEIEIGVENFPRRCRCRRFFEYGRLDGFLTAQVLEEGPMRDEAG